MHPFQLSEAIEPRVWQSEALEIWSSGKVGVVRVVTGGGKTVFALLCMERYIRDNLDTRVVIVVPTVALMDQWFVELMSLTSLNEDDVSLHGGGNRYPEFGRVCLMVINTARSLARKARQGVRTMLIVDECHRSATNENRKAIDIAPNATLGLSATPEREYDEGFEEIISPILGEVIYDYDYTRANKDGVISKFKLVNVKITLSEDEEEEYRNLTKSIARSSGLSDDEIPLSALKRSGVVACAARRVPGAVAIVKLHRTEKTIIFHERIEEMMKIHSSLRENGVNALAYHSKQGPHIRRSNLMMFRKGISNVLVTCRALDEGLDVPDASVGIVAASTASTRQRIQRLGRILRPSPGKSVASIYTLYTTEREEKRLVAECVSLEGITDISWMEGVTE